MSLGASRPPAASGLGSSQFFSQVSDGKNGFVLTWSRRAMRRVPPAGLPVLRSTPEPRGRGHVHVAQPSLSGDRGVDDAAPTNTVNGR